MPSSRAYSLLVLLGFLVACFAVAAIGGAVTAASVGTWYQTLNKPPFNPPDWVFAPVWTLLYALIAVAGWRVWRKAGWRGARKPLTLYAAQLVLNLGWSIIFFGLQNVGLAFAEILVLLALIVATARAFRSIDRIAALLFVPYAIWVTFAAVLNGAILFLNG